MTNEEANLVELEIINQRLFRDSQKKANLDLITRLIKWYQDNDTKKYTFYGIEFIDVKVLVNSIYSILPSDIELKIDTETITIIRL